MFSSEKNINYGIIYNYKNKSRFVVMHTKPHRSTYVTKFFTVIPDREHTCPIFWLFGVKSKKYLHVLIIAVCVFISFISKREYNKLHKISFVSHQ